MTRHMSRWLLVGAALLGVAWQADAQQLTFRLGTVDPQATHSGVGSDAFAAAVDRLSKGQMKIQVFHAGQLGPIPEQQRNVLAGTQDMHLLFPEFLTTLIDESRIISAPYVFTSQAHQANFLKSAAFKPGLDKLRDLGAIVLDEDWTWWQMDPRGVISVRPIRTPQDLQGMKLRIWESKVAIETWKGLGANTIVVPRPEMYLAFKQGIIEGGPETVGIAVDGKNAEIGKYWTRTDEYFQVVNIMMNQRRWQGLTDEQRTILRQAAKEGGAAFKAESLRGFSDKRTRAEKEFSVTVLEPDLTPWREKSKAILAALESDGIIPKGLAAKAAAIPAQ
ncbi:MAG: TRAP transporter substrate-binding protein [Alphaproteobacteria bacterium]|nr:TRAP transporter substrate-binding protein [Alphaproteobacteria bacterium]